MPVVRPFPARVAAVFLAIALAACGQPASEPAAPVGPEEELVEPGQLPADSRSVIAVLGDSLTAGYGLLTTEAFPTRLEALFHGEGYSEIEVLNAGVSGDTTAGGLRRAPELLAPNVRIVVVALGGNDALRGLSVEQSRQNLQAIIDGFLAADVRVLLAGMEAPTNLGEDYRARFRAIFTGLGDEYRGRIHRVPFLLEGVAGNPSLNQADGIHPTAQGQQMIADLLYPTLRDMVDQLPVMQ